MKILWITDSLPQAHGGGAATIYYHLLKHVSRQHQVFLACLVRSDEEQRQAAELGQFCQRVEAVVDRKGRRSLRTAVRVLLSDAPPLHRHFWSEELALRIQRMCLEETIDIAQIEHAHMAAYVRRLGGGPTPRRILCFHNIGRTYYRRLIPLEKRPRHKVELVLGWLRSRRWERRILRHADACLTLSTNDWRQLDAEAQRKGYVIPHGIDTEVLRPLVESPASRELLMVGNMSYLANEDALRFFAKRIFASIRAEMPGVHVTVVGRNPPRGIADGLAPESFTITGGVDSVAPYYQRAALLVVPLRAGSGVRGKILEAMAFGRPVVTTSIGCEGLDVTHGKELLIADRPSDFAACVLQLLRDPALRATLRESGRRLVEAQHSWPTVADKLLRVYEGLASLTSACRAS